MLVVSTFNVRYGGVTGSDAWYGEPGRGALVASQLDELGADIYGLQEVLSWQLADIATGLPDHDHVGVGRDDGAEAGEFVPIFFRRDRLALLSSGHFWLSETPDTPGTTFAGAATNRMVSWARLRERESGDVLLVLNTHWDHVSRSARMASSALIQERVWSMQPEGSLLVLGDLNDGEESASVTGLREGLQLVDAYRASHPQPDGEEGTYHGFTGDTSGAPIDFVLCGAPLAPLHAEIVRWSADGVYPSDHYPVLSTLGVGGDGRE